MDELCPECGGPQTIMEGELERVEGDEDVWEVGMVCIGCRTRWISYYRLVKTEKPECMK